MSIYFLGDVHGDPLPSLSYKKNPNLKSLNNNDTIIQLGDFGVPFFNKDINGGYADNIFKWLSTRPYNFIVVAGNHENFDYWETCPIVDIFGGKARQAMTKKYKYPVYFIDSPTILTIENKKILCLPKGDSHDINNLLNPKDKNFKTIKKKLNKRFREGDWSAHYRVIGETWWPQEKIDIDLYDGFVDNHAYEHFDFICSHIPPAFVSNAFGYNEKSEGERYFEFLFDRLNFDYWVHGHLHINYYSEVSGICGLFSNVVESNDIVNLKGV